MGVSEGLPSLVEPYLARPDKTYPSPESVHRLGALSGGSAAAEGGERRGRPAHRNGAADTRFVRARDDASGARTESHADGHGARAIEADFADGSSGGAARGTSGDCYHTDTACGPARRRRPPAPAKPVATTPAPAAKAPSSVKAEVKEVDRAAERAAEKAREQERKAAEAEAKQKAEEDKVAQAKAEEDRRQADRLAKDRAKREAEIARRNAEVAKKQADDDAKREKALAEAAARLKQAQTAYQAEVEKTKGGSNDKSKEPGKS